MKKNMIIVLLVLLFILSVNVPQTVSIRYGPFDKSDLENIRQFVMEWEEPSQEDLKRYDITKDGSITQMDYFYAQRMVKGLDPNPQIFQYEYFLKLKNV